MTLGLIGILLGLVLLVGMAFRGWSVLGLTPVAALVAAAFSGEPLLAHWTQTFMGSAAGFVAQFFPLFLLGAAFGKLMDDSGSVTAIAQFMTDKLGPDRSILAVVLAGALVTYGGVTLFVAMFVLVPMGQALFRAADIPNRLLPGTVMLGTATFSMSALPGSPSIPNSIPMPFFGTTTFSSPGLGFIGAVIMLVFGMWWLGRAEAAARRAGEGFSGPNGSASSAAKDPILRERASVSHDFDPAEIEHGARSETLPGIVIALSPLIVVMLVNLLMTLVLLPRMDTSYLAELRWGETSLAGVGGVWSVIVALLSGIIVLYALNRSRLLALRETVDAGLNAAVLPLMSVASLVGFGAVVASLPAFEMVRLWVLSIEGGPLVGLAVATNVLSALTGSASGGLTIALGALSETYLILAAKYGIDPALLHRVAVMGAGSLDSLPHNGVVVTLFALCGVTHKDSYFDILIVGVLGALLGLVAVVVLGATFGSF